MTVEEILKRMADGWGLSMYPGGIRLTKDGEYSHLVPNSRFYELFRDGFITFQSIQGHFEIDVIKLGLTPKGRELVE